MRSLPMHVEESIEWCLVVYVLPEEVFYSDIEAARTLDLPQLIKHEAPLARVVLFLRN